MMRGSRRRKEGDAQSREVTEGGWKGVSAKVGGELRCCDCTEAGGEERGVGWSLVSDATERGEKRIEESKGALGIH